MDTALQINDTSEEDGSDAQAQENENSKIFSLYLRPSCRERLGIVKRWLGLSYSDTLDLLLGHLIQENILPEEAIDELEKAGLFKDSDMEELALLGIHCQWPKSAKLVSDIARTNKKISAELEELISCIEDHAEAIILNNQ